MSINKTIAQEIDFESDNEVVSAVAGVNDDELTSTQKIVGIKPLVRTTTVVKLANGTSVSVKFSRKYNGSIWMREAANGSSYTWADVTIIEFDKSKVERIVTTEAADYRKAYDKDTKTFQMVEGAKVRLNTDREGMLVRNSAGTFAPEVDGKIACNQGRSKFVDEVKRSTFTRFLTTKHFNGEKMVPDATLKEVLDVDTYNNRLHSRVAAVKRNLMARLPEDASDTLIEAASAKADTVASNIVAGFEHCIKRGSLKKAHVLTMEGFRVFKYIKDTGIELSTCLPSDKVESRFCPDCANPNPNVTVTENGWTCSYGHMGDGDLPVQTKYVDRYVKDPENEYRQLVDVATDCVKAIEYAYYIASGLTPTKRQFKGTCSSCAHCSARVYGQNQEPIQVSCSKGMKETMEMDEHWELERTDLVSLGNSFYLAHSEKHDQPALYGNCRGVASRKLWGHKNKRKVELERMIYTDTQGIAGYEVPGWLSFEKLALMYETFGKAMLLDLLGDRTFENDQEKYLVYRETVRGMMGDYLTLNRFVLLMEQMKADQDDLSLEYDIELEAVADPEYFRQLLDLAHPLFKDMVLETAASKLVHDLYPNTMREMQTFIQPESNPRMIKAGASQDIMMDEFDADACLEFHWEFAPGQKVNGVASFAAAGAMYDAKQ